jgi:minor curlin subunit
VIIATRSHVFVTRAEHELKINVRFRKGSRLDRYKRVMPLRNTATQQSLDPPRRAPMKTRIALIASALVLSLSLGAPAAFAGSNTVNIEQWGIGNAVGGGQKGKKNRLTVRQTGVDNTAISTQNGKRNVTVVGQTGNGNSADTDQNGKGNIVGVAQMGNGQTVVTSQDGNRNAIGVIQAGDGNNASAHQIGKGNVTVIVQE